MKSVVILIDYFGAWPGWFPVFLASCRANRTIDWIIKTDCEVPADPPPNVKFVQMAFGDYVAHVSRGLGIDFNPAYAYKICDVRPMYGELFWDEIKDYDYYGFGDLDVVYGDIRKFYTDEVLSRDVISTHVGMLSGHLSLFRNIEVLRKAYLRIPGWKDHLENPESTRFDEDVYSTLFVKGRCPEADSLAHLDIHFQEQYTTVFHPMPWHDGQAEHPDVWYWKNGIVTNNRNIGRDYLYLHLMNFQSMRWTGAACRERHIPWKNNPDVVFTRAGEEANGVKIEWSGIRPLTEADTVTPVRKPSLFDIDDFQDNLAPYECVRVRDTRTVWINDADIGDLAGVLDPAARDTSFARAFSYVPRSNRCFDEAALDTRDRRIYVAERYGGRGVGNNGGGGRVGNFGNHQVKGTGPNPVVGSDSTWHSYGSLNLVDAGHEAIYSTVLDRVLPIGCARIYGIIHSSATGALKSLAWGTSEARMEPAPGAFLVRERTVRPGHFMHAEMFAPPKASGLPGEPSRVRAAHRLLKAQFGDNNQFIRFIGQFILSSAKQFAFARAARIAHGGVTPSNICMDGRWIDLTEARFLSGGKNYRTLMPFHDEPGVIVEVVRSLTYTYGKSNLVQFNIEPLLRYYQTAFDGCFAYYALSILGLPDERLDDISESEDGKALATAYGAVILKGKLPLPGGPAGPDPEDPVIAFMRTCYLGLAQTEDGALPRTPAVTAFRNAFRGASALPEGAAPHLVRNAGIACAIKALRWAYLSAYYYRARITVTLYDLVDNGDLSALGGYIQDAVDQSAWIFDTACTGCIVILETDGLRLTYDQARHHYDVTAGGERRFTRYADCLAFVTAAFPALRIGADFDPSFYLQGIADVLAGLERMDGVPL